MISYPFEYARAGSVEEALQLLGEHGADARLLAGGHSLIPAMKLRMNLPSLLVDVSHIADLARVEESPEGFRLGALVTHRTVERSGRIRARCSVLSEAAATIGDPQVRNRGTLGGSLAHADPSADYPAVMLALDAVIHTASRNGTRAIPAADFFLGLFQTALVDGEMITAVTVPALEERQGAAYAKFENPASRFAVVGVAACVALDAGGRCRSARVGVTGAAPAAFRATGVEERLVGEALTPQAITGAVADMAASVDLLGDLSGSAAYRAHLCEVMARRALLAAAERAAS